MMVESSQKGIYSNIEKVSAGELFLKEQTLYMKIYDYTSFSGYSDTTGVNLESGALRDFKYKTVTPVDQVDNPVFNARIIEENKIHYKDYHLGRGNKIIKIRNLKNGDLFLDIYDDSICMVVYGKDAGNKDFYEFVVIYTNQNNKGQYCITRDKEYRAISVTQMTPLWYQKT